MVLRASSFHFTRQLWISSYLKSCGSQDIPKFFKTQKANDMGRKTRHEFPSYFEPDSGMCTTVIGYVSCLQAKTLYFFFLVGLFAKLHVLVILVNATVGSNDSEVCWHNWSARVCLVCSSMKLLATENLHIIFTDLHAPSGCRLSSYLLLPGNCCMM